MNNPVERFVQEMNRTSLQYGLTDTKWINPSGLRQDGKYSQSTCYDIAQLGRIAFHNETIRSIWNQKSHKLTMGGGIFSEDIMSSIKYELFDERYRILGGKTGGGDGHHALVVVSEINKRPIVCSIYGTRTPDDRFYAINELLDVLYNKRSSVVTATNACVIDDETGNILYNKNCQKTVVPMSITKLMTILTALRYITNLRQEVAVEEDDLIGTHNTSGCLFQPGYTINIQELLYAALLPSSNQAANIIARVAGEIIISSNCRENNNQDS